MLKKSKIKGLVLVILLIVPIIPLNLALCASDSINIEINGSSENLIGVWEPLFLDWKIYVYTIPSVDGFNSISWSTDKDSISSGDSVLTTFDLEVGRHTLGLDFRIIFEKKSTRKIILDKTVGVEYTINVPGSLNTPKVALPVIPLEVVGLPIEISLSFRLSFTSEYYLGINTDGLLPTESTIHYTSEGSSSISFSKQSGVGAKISISQATVSSYGTITVGIGLSVSGFLTPFNMDFTSVAIPAFTSSNIQSLYLLVLKTPVSIGHSLQSQTVNIGDSLTISGVLSPIANNVPIQLYVDGVNVDSTNTQSDGTFVVGWNPMNAGTFSLSLKASETDYTLETASTSTQITVNKPPDSSFRFSPVNPQAKENIQFTNESFDLDGQITNWLWEFSDGTTANTKNPTHYFENVGTYDVTLTVTDNEGAIASYQSPITISKIPTELSLKISQSDIVEDDSIQILSSINPEVEGLSIEYTLTKPDGTSISKNDITSLDGICKITHVTSDSGKWTVEASFFGNSNYVESTSQTLSFNVEKRVVKSGTIESDKVESGEGGIPGFHYEAIIIGLIICVILLRKNKL